MTRPEFDQTHRVLLPARCASGVGRVAARDVRDVPPLAFRLTDGRAWRFVTGGDTLQIATGDDAPTVVELDEAAWQDFADELCTAAGLLYGGRARFVRGEPAGLERWEPALRALFQERSIADPSGIALRDREGGPLEVRRSFSLDDPSEELRHFLYETGFLHVRQVFSPDEVARLAALVARRQEAARPGDGRSWWARRADGATVLCRLIYLGLDCPEIAALSDDPRLARVASLVGRPLRAACDRSDGHSAVIKNAGVVEGLSDLPWHRDCGLGGHPVTCPALNVGIQLDAATEATGRLLFVPGSWRGSWHRSDLARAPVVAVDTAPGDVTVHVGDVFHAAPPPTGAGPGRRAVYVSFMPVGAFDVIPAGQSYNDVIRARVAR